MDNLLFSGWHGSSTLSSRSGLWRSWPYCLHRTTAVLAAVIVSLLIRGPAVPAMEVLPVGLFSAIDIEADAGDDMLPENWEPMTFKKIDAHTRYTLVREEDQTVIRAESTASASGLIRHIRINPAEFPIIRWRWKITGVYEKGDVTRKSGDDYPARIYIAFEYDSRRVGFLEKAKYETARMLYGQYPPAGAINYIWANRALPGTRVPNPYTDRVMMIVVAGGDADSHTWMTVERNLYQDYLDNFGEPPPMISGVGLMTDSDNTGESTVSYYGDIVFMTGSQSSGDPD